MSIPDLLEGLNCCSGNVNSRDCDACPYFNERRCLDKLLEHAAEVINGMRGGGVMMVPGTGGRKMICDDLSGMWRQNNRYGNARER